jgi:hypothetical protein
MARSRQNRWNRGDETRNTYPSVNPPGPARGGGSGERAPLEKEIRDAMKDADRQDKRSSPR